MKSFSLPNLFLFLTLLLACPMTFAINCQGQDTRRLQLLVVKLNQQGTIKQNRYVTMMNEFRLATSCEQVNAIMISAVEDCTVKSAMNSTCR